MVLWLASQDYLDCFPSSCEGNPERPLFRSDLPAKPRKHMGHHGAREADSTAHKAFWKGPLFLGNQMFGTSFCLVQISSYTYSYLAPSPIWTPEKTAKWPPDAGSVGSRYAAPCSGVAGRRHQNARSLRNAPEPSQAISSHGATYFRGHILL